MRYNEMVEFTHYLERGDEEIEVQVKGRAYYRSGVYSAAPENCYEDEGEVELLSCRVDGRDFHLSSDEEDVIRKKIGELAEEQVGERMACEADERMDHQYDREDEKW